MAAASIPHDHVACFLIHGPNIGTGHNSVLQMLESQAGYIASAIGMRRSMAWAPSSRPRRRRRRTQPGSIG
jgi:hypothetical protein